MEYPKKNKRIALVFFPYLDVINRYVVIMKISKILSRLYDFVVIIIPLYRRNIHSTLQKNLKEKNIIIIKLFEDNTASRSLKFATLLATILTLKRFYKTRPTLFILAPSISLIPLLLIARFLKIKVSIFAGGSIKTTIFHSMKQYLKALPHLLILILHYLLANKILIETPRVSTFFEILASAPLKKKIIPHAHLWVPDEFDYRKPLHLRQFDICYAGVLDDIKGFPLLLATIEELVKNKPTIKVAIASSGGPLEPLLEKQKLSRLSENITVFKSIAYENMPSFLNECKTLLLLSKSEGLPNIVLEAMSCGCVVVATPVGGIPDVIQNGQTGILVVNRRPEEVSKTLLKLLNDPKTMEVISENARLYVKREYRFEKILQRWLRIVSLIEMV